MSWTSIKNRFLSTTVAMTALLSMSCNTTPNSPIVEKNKVIGNMQTRKYHIWIDSTKHCRFIDSIKAGNRIDFSSCKEAKDSSYDRCASVSGCVDTVKYPCP